MVTQQAARGARLTPGRRQRKKSEQRRSLQWAALRLADEHGYRQLTVEAIADAADVSTRTFFNYFPSKEEALLSPGPDVVRGLLASLIGRPAEESALTALHVVLHQAAREVADDLELWQARMRVVEANPQLWSRLSSSFFLIERALATGIGRRLGTDPRCDPYTVLVASCATAAMRVALMQWRLAPDRQLPERLHEHFDRLAGGLAEPPDSILVKASLDTSANDLLVIDEQPCR